jgi:hypothetical protein
MAMAKFGEEERTGNEPAIFLFVFVLSFAGCRSWNLHR